MRCSLSVVTFGVPANTAFTITFKSLFLLSVVLSQKTTKTFLKYSVNLLFILVATGTRPISRECGMP